MTETDTQLSKVQLRAPGIPGEHAAYDTGERWNGAVCPLFDREQAEDFAEAYAGAREDHEAWYDEERDAFCFDSTERALEEPECFPGKAIDGRKFYPIGSRCWVWQEA